MGRQVFRWVMHSHLHGTLSNQHGFQCRISKDDSGRGQAVRGSSRCARVSAQSYRLTNRMLDQAKRSTHQKKTAQIICTSFLLNDTSEARTIGVAGSNQDRVNTLISRRFASHSSVSGSTSETTCTSISFNGAKIRILNLNGRRLVV